MRKLLRTIRSSVASREQRRQEEQQVVRRLEEGSSSEDHDEDGKQVAQVQAKKQDEIGDNSTHEPRQPTDDGDNVLDLRDITRICKRDTKKERREKYKLCFERNNVCMVSVLWMVVPSSFPFFYLLCTQTLFCNA